MSDTAKHTSKDDFICIRIHQRDRDRPFRLVGPSNRVRLVGGHVITGCWRNDRPVGYSPDGAYYGC